MSGRTFRACAKTFLLTYPKCDEPKEAIMDFLLKKGASEVIVAREEHLDGSPHIHAFVEFEKRKDIVDCRYFDVNKFHANFGKDTTFGKKSKKASKVDMIKYVIKGGDYIEFNIDARSYLNARESHTAYVCKKLITGKCTIPELIEEDPAMLMNITTLQKSLAVYKNLKALESYPGKRESYWIWGKPGIGKSYYIRHKYPDAYLKAMNKWWDGYMCQDVVILEEFETDTLGHYLKLWTDQTLFPAEIKGGTIQPTYTKFFITSNNTIDQVFGGKEGVINDMMILAIKRRIIEIHADNHLVKNEDGNYYFSMSRWVSDMIVMPLVYRLINNCISG